MTQGAFLELAGITHGYAGQPVVRALDLQVRQGEFISLLGPSGCGKTTLLHVIAGFLQPDQGDVRLQGASLRNVPSHRRGVAMVFQNYALFPHMDVHANVAFGLRMQRRPKAEIRRRVAQALELVQLPGYGERFPDALSGGQRQRVALARALVLEPRLLLLDEPLSNLDARLRQALREEFLRIHRLTGMTTVLVTHDLEEAFATSDRVAVMAQGSVQQFDAPETIYKRPATAFVADYLGHGNRLHGYSIPEHALRAGAAADGAGNRRAGRLLALTYLGASVRFEVEFDGVVLRGVQPPGTWLSGAVVGQPIQAGWDTDDMVPLPAGAG